jgi:hypothetical protein
VRAIPLAEQDPRFEKADGADCNGFAPAKRLAQSAGSIAREPLGIGEPADNDVGVEERPVAVGTAVADCPPHRPVLALLTHTVPTLDVGVLGVEAYVGTGVQSLDRW